MKFIALSGSVLGDRQHYHFKDNLSRSIQHAGRVIVEMIPKIYDTARTLRIIGNDGVPSHAQVDPDQQDAMTEQVDERGEVTKIYNLGVGEYDVTVTVGPSYSTKRQEFAAMMGDMFSRDPQLMQMAGDLYFRSIDMPGSEQIADRLKKMLPPQLQDKQEGQPEIPPQTQAQIQQMQNALHQSEQHMQQLEQQLQQLQFEQRAKLVESDGKLAEARVRQESELARAMADVEIAKANSVDPARMDAAESILAQLMMQVQGQQSQEPDPAQQMQQVDPEQQMNQQGPQQ